MSEETTKRISAITGRQPTECACEICKRMCQRTPCLGTPDDIERIIDAGYGHKIVPSGWAAGIIARLNDHIIPMYQPEGRSKNDGTCAFYTHDGLCELHDKGLKPTEGRLAHHIPGLDQMVASFHPAWHVAQEWEKEENFETIKRIEEKLNT